MNKFTFSALLFGGLLSSAGCVITADSNAVDSGELSVSWSTDVACPAGAQAEIFAQDQVNPANSFSDLYDCVAGGGAVSRLPLGTYDVWVEIVDASATAVFAKSSSLVARLQQNGDLINLTFPQFPLNDGFLAMTWTLSNSAGTPVACADVFSGGVDILATSASTSDAKVTVFDCPAGTGITGAMPLDTYTVVVDVLDTANPAGALQSSTAIENTITFGNEIVDLGNYDFVF